MAAEIRFVLSYMIFLSFVLMMISMGAPQIVDDETRRKLEEKYNLDDLSLWERMTMFWDLVKLSSQVRWVTLMVLMPLGVGMVYILLRLVRGGG